uniref:NADH:quinone oxidoreductase/Mrp antiporter transmembrane domain-containing protein n=1 Tax=Salix viminalis TaxID=40686 RepID=A0A6N2L2F6_SALVM
MGAYGLVRIKWNYYPTPILYFLLGAIQIIYAASTSSGQKNLKKRIAYSSVSHMEQVMIEYVLFILTKWRNGYPNAKNIHDVQYLSLASLALPGMSGFFAELVVFLE